MSHAFGDSSVSHQVVIGGGRFVVVSGDCVSVRRVSHGPNLQEETIVKLPDRNHESKVF